MSETLDRFIAGLSFEPDDYQVKACQDLDDGAGVLVAAPTGAGKTVVGEYATDLALASGLKCFYTTPIKALSNQKFHDLVTRHGEDQVGLLTGDVTINSEAPVIVMTTEVLRNMIYRNSHTLDTLGWVVLDEVHYLADRFRGPVWEEVILGLDPRVKIVGLSATVSNAEEFGEWLDEVRGDVRVVVSERRPVPLVQHVAVARRLYELFDSRRPTEVNPELTSIAKEEARFQRDDYRRPRGRSGKGKRSVSYGTGRFGGASAQRRGRGGRPRGPRNQTSRIQVVRSLHKVNLLPAIIFVFSRSGCDAAVSQLLNTDLVLTSQQEARQLRRIAQRRGEGLTDEERRAVGWNHFMAAFERGIAAHHAGLLPVIKAIVEEGFVAGLLKVVVATETLALGINMPARTVVLEKLVKYNGQTHADITPGEYTQLTGRAGRRGIDTQGHAVVCWQPGMDPRAVAGLASRRTYPLNSTFVPTYNMAVNLVGSMGREKARDLLEHSFAQFQIDRRLGGSAVRNRQTQADIEAYLKAAHCERGDFTVYARLRENIRELEHEQARLRKVELPSQVADSLSSLDPGDIIAVPSGRHAGWVVVVDPGTHGTRGQRPRPLVMTPDRTVIRLGHQDIDAPVTRVAGVKVPRHFHPENQADRRCLGKAFDRVLEGLGRPVVKPRRAAVDAELSDQITELRSQMKAHPCHSCPDRESHARFAERAMRLRRRSERELTKARAKATSIATQFERIVLVLEALGYLGTGGDTVTDAGRMLSGIYSELDLVTAEAIRRGVFDGLDCPQLAAVLSTIVHESRPGDRGHLHRMPDGKSEAAESQLRAVRAEIGLLERDHRIERPRDLDIGFAEASYAWAAGAGLDTVLDDMSAGDFVRRVRQVCDLAGQIAHAGVGENLAHTCRQVVGAMQRGVVTMDREED